MKALRYFFFTALILFGLTSCKKGATGPTGPTGAQGNPGQNTTYKIDSATIQPSQWGGSAGYFSVSNPPINVTSLDSPNSSLVYVYFSLSDNSKSIYLPLPAINAFTSGDYLAFYAEPYNVYLFYNGSTPPSVTMYVKIITVPEN